MAQNVLRGKIKDIDLVPKDASGQARAELLWKGEVVLSSYKGDPLSPPILPIAPAPDMASAPMGIEAFVLLNFEMSNFNISGVSGVAGTLDIGMR